MYALCSLQESVQTKETSYMATVGNQKEIVEIATS